MSTNEERREVAIRLRRYLSYAIKHDADEHVEPCIHGNAMFRNIAQAVGGGISNITDTYEETLVKLIDLIEPEPERTCGLRSRLTGPYCYECTECGKGMKADWAYCPKCGSEVVS